MPGVIVVGAQWGDEGKGKIVDVLAANAQHIVRAQGGNNAGHTVVVGHEEYKLHLIPTGILHTHAQCYISAGTALDPEVLVREIQGLQARGISLKNRLWISPYAHLILPYHRKLDLLFEQRRGESKIGTTGRGIGPCYSDKINRIGIRICDLIHPDLFSNALEQALALKNEELAGLYDEPPLDFKDIYQASLHFAEMLLPFVANVEEMVYDALKKGDHVLFEGAQGTFLDIGFGTYPFVTSSHTIAGGICAGAGIGPSCIDHTIGVVKAYTTRVGNGPFPTEAREGERILDHNVAREHGTTTGRKRRIGWFDAALVKTAVRLNGMQSMALTKLDILDGLDSIKIGVGYLIDGRRVDAMPMQRESYSKIEPIYETVAGWKASTAEATFFESLSNATKEYIKRIEILCGIPVSILSLGPERHRTIILKDVFTTE